MAKLLFRFDLEKLVAALGYFATSGVKDLTKLKAVKLLYLADQYHLFRHGRPVIGDRYLAMDLGPVPENAYEFIGRLTEPAEVEDSARTRALEALAIERWSNLRHLKYPVIRAKRKPDLDVFSDSDIDALDAVRQKYGDKSAQDLVNLTHEHRAYKRADATRPSGSSVPLPYEFFFEDAAEPQRTEALTLAELGQEDRDYAERLSTAARQASSDASSKPVTR